MSAVRSFRLLILLAAAVLVLAGDAVSTPAAAQGLFESFFGNLRRAAPQVRAFADPFGRGDDEDQPRREGGVYASHCVRLCDGRHFPLPRGNANPVELCQSLCPASKTKVFAGSGIDQASASDGSRYADLENAFVYRDKLVDSCTCNGKTSTGLASVDAKSDPTLKPGDIVATREGLMAYQGKRNAEFTPVDRSVLSKEWRSRLSAMRVAPVQEEAPDDSILPPRERANRSQVSR